MSPDEELVRKGLNNPSHGNFPFGGVPPPAGHHRQDFPEKLTEISLRKRGVLPPGRSVAKNGSFSPKTAFFAQIIFLAERGVPPPPLNGQSVVEKLTERGGSPPPPLNGKFPCLGFLNPSLIAFELLSLYIQKH